MAQTLPDIIPTWQLRMVKLLKLQKTLMVEKMKILLRDAMENGTIGLSFGLIYTPSCYSETEELIELAMVVKEYNGMISAHIRDEGFKRCQKQQGLPPKT